MIEFAGSNKGAPMPAARRKMLRPSNILIAIAVLELLTVLWELLFGQMSILLRAPLELAEPAVGDILVKTYLACHPLLALAGLAFASTSRVRYAIFALGSLVLMRWLNYMPSVVLNGLKLADGFDIQWTAAQIFVFPMMAACAIALAARDKRLGFATALTSVPTFYNIFGFAVFTAIAIINGF